MILQPCNVELTKIYYYDHSKSSQNLSVPTISKEINHTTSIIKKNIFGQRWVLRINETQNIKKKRKFDLRVWVYGLVFFSLLVAIGFGIFFSFDHKIFKADNRNTSADTQNLIKYLHLNNTNRSYVFDNNFIGPNSSLKETNSTDKISLEQITVNKTLYCHNCSSTEICLKTDELAKPRCVSVVDKRDPTGCGGLCQLNIEYCKSLDKLNQVFQCLPLKTLLKCPKNTFNCGDMCITTDKKCDGKNDCANKADEKNCVCDLNTHFHCGNETSCLEKKKLCDGKVDCWDKSDETECLRSVRCAQNYIPCLNGECILKEKLCNKVFDCRDKSDEPAWCQFIQKF